MQAEVAYRDLGTIAYGTCWELQQSIFDRILQEKRQGTARTQVLILCEHPHVYTLGKSGHPQNLLVDEKRLHEIGAEFYHIDRGGDITYHGPGQLVGYPILDLEREGIGLREYIHALEQTVIDTVADYGISAGRIDGAAGVWLTETGKAPRKICALGVRSSHYVTMHGFALNVNTDLRYFDYINPCGFADRGATSLERETGRKMSMDEVKERLLHHAEKNMNIKIIKENNHADREKMGG